MKSYSPTELHQTVEQILDHWETFPDILEHVSYNGLRDRESGEYVLLQTRCREGQAVVQAVSSLKIQGNKILITFDTLEKGIAQEFRQRGVPDDQIVYTFDRSMNISDPS